MPHSTQDLIRDALLLAGGRDKSCLLVRRTRNRPALWWVSLYLVEDLQQLGKKARPIAEHCSTTLDSALRSTIDELRAALPR